MVSYQNSYVVVNFVLQKGTILQHVYGGPTGNFSSASAGQHAPGRARPAMTQNGASATLEGNYWKVP